LKVNYVDDDVGRVVALLNQTGLYENTLIVLHADSTYSCGCWIALHADSQPLVHTALAFALTPILFSPSQMAAKSSATVRKQTPAQVGPRRPCKH